MNVSIISKIFKRKNHSKNKKSNISLNNHNIQIVKLKGKNNVKNNLNINRLKISTHYLGEIDKRNFGITSAKLNMTMLKKNENENEIIKKSNNKEIKSNAYLSDFQIPRKIVNNFNESFIFKFEKINIPKYNKNLSCENLKFQFSGCSKIFKNLLFKNLKNNNYRKLKKINNSDYLDKKFFEEFENLYKYDNYFNKSKKKIHSRNINPYIKSILSKNFSQVIYPYELKYKKVKSNNFFDCFSDERFNNLLKSNNFKSRKLFHKIFFKNN